jgi:[acyl-carrier-protein] S-malonyltransferase
MQPAADRLAAYLKNIEIKKPAIPVINNVDVAAYDDAAKIKDALVRQLHSPVRWVETVQKMAAMGVTTLVECGPGKVLAGLNKRIAKDMTVLPVYDGAGLDEALKLISQ